MKDEIEERFGVLPNFFRTAQAAPGLMDHLWAFAKGAYLDLPIPSVFKERLFVYLSRFCEVRYCVVRHCGFLVGRGKPAGDGLAPLATIEDALELLSLPSATEEQLIKYLNFLNDQKSPITRWPDPGTPWEMAIFACAAEIFLSPNVSQKFRFALKHALGDTNFEMLLGYLAFIRTAHFWTLVHPELEYEEDVEALLENHTKLSQRLLKDPVACRYDVSEKFRGELEELRKEKKAYDQLKESQEQLVQAINARDEFLSLASHELKTPLTTLGLTTEMIELQENPSPESVKKYIGQVKKYHTRLSRLVTDMLDISKVRSGEIQLDLEEVDFAAALKELIDRMMPELLKAANGLPPTVDISCRAVGLLDALRFEQVISNLLINAMKYGGGKPIEIILECRDSEALVSIKDQGMGISKENQKRIFNRFERAIHKNEVSGLGLGLYIVKQIVEAHRGRIEVISELGKGSTFTIVFPLQIKNPSSDSRRILIVEDDPDISEIYTEIFQVNGFKVIQVSNGEEALDILENAAPDGPLPDCILLDLMMPVMDGKTFLNVLQDKYPHSHAKIPVLVSTALHVDASRNLPLSPRVLPKPANLQTLVNEVKALLL